LSRAVLDIEGVKVAFYVTHLSYESKEDRAPQIQFIKEKMDTDPFAFKILVGDFNNSSFNELDSFLVSYNLVNSNEHDYITFPTTNFKSIDNIIISKNITINNTKVINSLFSDHMMLMTDISITTNLY
jgi:endonuclease/exonuclease/phosphatase family metal-dependent hydrolase